jgi:hypothetical protein
MPKTNIDYSNTIIYKIFCNDETVTDLYVGHTTNFVQRKYAHKISCTHEKTKNYNCKLYKIIRANGGWTNWTMEIVNFFNCKDHTEARIKEQEYFLLLKATLNSIEPFPEKIVKDINIEENIIVDNNNLDEININENVKNNTLYCEICKTNTASKKDYNKHLLTLKHQKMISNVKSQTPLKKCNSCNKLYVSRNGLWKHLKTCKPDNNEFVEKQDTLKIKIEQFTLLSNTIIVLQKQLAEFVINK